MKKVLFIMLTICCYNCFGQNELLFIPKSKESRKSNDIQFTRLPDHKFSRDLSEQLDSALNYQQVFQVNEWLSTDASRFTYDNEHRLAIESYLYYDPSTNEIYDGDQQEYYYNIMGLCTLYYSNSFEGPGEWRRDIREEIKWNTDSLLVESISSEWDPSSVQFVYTSKAIATYLPSNLTKENIFYDWDEDADDWTANLKIVFAYNNADSLLLEEYYYWDEDIQDWLLRYYADYYYTNETLLDSVIEYTDSGSGLELSNKRILETNSEGLLVSETGYIWEDIAWEPWWQDIYEYTPEGWLSRDTYYEWDQDEQRFVEDYLDEFVYTAAGDITSETASEFEPDFDAWIPDYRSEIFYDEGVDGSTIVWPNSPMYETVTYHRKPIYGLFSFYDFDQWYVTDSTALFYGDLISSTIPLSQVRVKTFPNPATNQISFEGMDLHPGANISFFDQQGKLAGSQSIQDNSSVSVSGLTSGAYFFRIRNGKELFSGKFIKE